MAEEMRTCKPAAEPSRWRKGLMPSRARKGGSIITNRAKPAATRQSGKSARKNARRREPRDDGGKAARIHPRRARRLPDIGRLWTQPAGECA